MYSPGLINSRPYASKYDVALALFGVGVHWRSVQQCCVRCLEGILKIRVCFFVFQLPDLLFGGAEVLPEVWVGVEVFVLVSNIVG